MIIKTWKILGFNDSVEIFLNSQHSVIVKNYNNCKFFASYVWRHWVVLFSIQICEPVWEPTSTWMLM